MNYRDSSWNIFSQIDTVSLWFVGGSVAQLYPEMMDESHKLDYIRSFVFKNIAKALYLKQNF